VSGGKSGRRQRPLASTRAQWGGPPVVGSHQEGVQDFHWVLAVLVDVTAALGMLQNGATMVELKCGNDDGKNSENRSSGPLFIGERRHAGAGLHPQSFP
jgi:hypothetical protein